MSKVFFDITVSLDGFSAGENRGPQNPLGDRMFGTFMTSIMESFSSPMATHTHYAVNNRVQ